MTDEELEDLKQMFENPQEILVSQEDYDRLIEMIENPSPPSPELIKLLQRKPPWNESYDKSIDTEV